MGYKIYRAGNYIKVIDIQTDELFNGHAKTVFIDKSNVNKYEYKILNVKDLSNNTILKIGEIFKEDDSPYSQAEWETFYENETGNFNLPQAGGGILNIGVTPSPDTSKINTIQYNDSGQIWIIDSDGVAVPIDALSSLGYTPEDVTNKSTDIEADKTSNTKYPTVKAVYDWSTNLFVKATDLATTLSNYATKLYVDTGLANKVDKITGYGLSKNDFTDTDKSKLDNIIFWQSLHQDEDRPLTNTIDTLQKAFSTSDFPNGAFTPPEIGVYEFEWEFAVQDLSIVSGILSVGFLGSATFTVKYHMTSQKTSFISSSAPFNIYAESAGIVNTYTSTVSSQAHGFISGTIDVTALGTIFPCFSFNKSATPLVKKGTIFKIAKSKKPISNFS